MTTSRLDFQFDDALMNRILERCAKETNSVSGVIHAAVAHYLNDHGSVLNDWVHELSFMQQSVLLAMIRNADGIAKHHPQKELIKWFRRCIVKSAFDRRQLHSPGTPGGGSFTGPVTDIEAALDEFIWARDEMTLHYFAHAMHAFEILGYHYPDDYVREFWFRAYHRMVAALHLMPESKYEMDKRLSDDPAAWRAREDKCGGCTSTEPPSDGATYAAVSQRMSDKTTIIDGKEVRLGEYTSHHEDALHKLAMGEHPEVEIREAPSFGVATGGNPVPAWAAVLDGHFVNAYTGLSLGHEFDLAWAHRIGEFKKYTELRPHDERGWQPK